MIKCLAFLRAVNVGGKNIIKMETLKRIFESLGFKNVRTYIQSGNVIFETEKMSKEKISRRIEDELHKFLTNDVLVFLKTYNEVVAIVKSNPFKKIKPTASAKLYICFIKGDLKKKFKPPIISKKKDVEIIAVENSEIYCVTPQINGRFGFPNNFVEEYFKVSATSRNWNTISKIISA